LFLPVNNEEVYYAIMIQLIEERYHQLMSQLLRHQQEQANMAHYHLSVAANRATSQYRISMELECAGSSYNQLEYLHLQNRILALEVFESLLNNYPFDLCQPYIDQVKNVSITLSLL
jgi:hypothetical protein